MSNDDDRLMRCFASALPGATCDEIRTATNFDAMAGWDSLRGVMLLAVLDEEFAVQIDLPELLELGTFDAVKGYLSQRATASRENK